MFSGSFDEGIVMREKLSCWFSNKNMQTVFDCVNGNRVVSGYRSTNNDSRLVEK